MEVVYQYIDYTSLDEFEFEEHDDLCDFDDRMRKASESDKVRGKNGRGSLSYLMSTLS
jgi:hypothetical protein